MERIFGRNRIQNWCGGYYKFVQGYLKMDKTREMKVKSGSIPCLPTELNLALTLHGGQSFR